MNFNCPTIFAQIPIGGKFIEALTTCDEIATRVVVNLRNGKGNARRSGGKYIWMADWEPVFIDGHTSDCLWATPLPTGEGYWGCDCGYQLWDIEYNDG